MRRSSRSKISRDEWVILGVAAPAVCISPFLLGGMVWWSQVSIASMQALIFLVALTPFSGFAAWRKRLVKLVKLPPFWLGGLFVLYVIIQALNPSMEQVYVDETSYFVADRKPEYFIAWLPQSILSNFYMMNAWRMVIFWAGAWAFVCGLWMSLNSRKAWLALGWMALATGAVLSLASIAHHLSDNEHLFWIEKYERNGGAFGPFVYRNQAAVYLYLTMGLGFAMALHMVRKGFLVTGIPWLAILFAVICLAGLGLNTSRGGWLGAAALILCFLFLLPFAIRWKDRPSTGGVIGAGVIIISILIMGGWYLKSMDFSEMKLRWQRLDNDEAMDASLRMRMALSEMTWEMFEDKPTIGWGAGSFRYRLPYYSLSYPEVHFIGNPLKKNYGKRKREFSHAHNDHFEILAEYGIVGYSLLAVVVSAWCIWIWVGRFASIELFMSTGALFVCLLHSFADFILCNPILLMSLLIVLVLVSGLTYRRASKSIGNSMHIAEK